MPEEPECLCSFGKCHYWDWCESCQEYDRWTRCPIHCPEDHKEFC